jgi:hypothetical protein
MFPGLAELLPTLLRELISQAMQGKVAGQELSACLCTVVRWPVRVEDSLRDGSRSCPEPSEWRNQIRIERR